MVIGKSYSVDSSHAVEALYIPSRPINIVGDPSKMQPILVIPIISQDVMVQNITTNISGCFVRFNSNLIIIPYELCLMFILMTLSYMIYVYSRPRFSRFSSFINGDNDEKGANRDSMVIYLIYYYI